MSIASLMRVSQVGFEGYPAKVVPGLRFRAGDGNLSEAEKLEILRQRVTPRVLFSDFSLTHRYTDGRLTFWAQRTPVEGLKVEGIQEVLETMELPLAKIIIIPAGDYKVTKHSFLDMGKILGKVAQTAESIHQLKAESWLFPLKRGFLAGILKEYVWDDKIHQMLFGRDLQDAKNYSGDWDSRLVNNLSLNDAGYLMNLLNPLLKDFKLCLPQTDLLLVWNSQRTYAFLADLVAKFMGEDLVVAWGCPTLTPIKSENASFNVMFEVVGK